MSDKANDSNAEMLKRFERDEQLMWPKADVRGKDRFFYSDYLHALVDNPTFVSALRQTEKVLERAKQRHNNKTNITNTVLCALFMALFVGAGIGEYKAIKNFEIVTTNSKSAQATLYTCFLAALLLAIIPIWSVASVNRKNRKYDEQPEVFFNRVIVRYFDVLKKMYPNMSEKYLQICNRPDMEMARAIYSLLIVNMPDADVKKLNEIALSVNWATSNDKMEVMRDIEEKIHAATQIIEKTLNTHPELQTVVADAYMAKVPKTFYIVNAQNQPRSR